MNEDEYGYDEELSTDERDYYLEKLEEIKQELRHNYSRGTLSPNDAASVKSEALLQAIDAILDALIHKQRSADES